MKVQAKSLALLSALLLTREAGMACPCKGYWHILLSKNLRNLAVEVRFIRGGGDRVGHERVPCAPEEKPEVH